MDKSVFYPFQTTLVPLVPTIEGLIRPGCPGGLKIEDLKSGCTREPTPSPIALALVHT